MSRSYRRNPPVKAWNKENKENRKNSHKLFRRKVKNAMLLEKEALPQFKGTQGRLTW
jgi:hypothetical protein